jgi:hypothetical protein
MNDSLSAPEFAQGPRVPYGSTAEAPRNLEPTYSSYLTHRVVEDWFDDGSTVALEPTTYAGPPHLSIRPVQTEHDPIRTYFSAWNPGGRATSLAENVQRHTELTNRLIAQGLRWSESAACAPDRSWAEQGVLVEGSGRELSDIAVAVEAPALVTYWEGVLTVTHPDGDVIATGQWDRVEQPPACPILDGVAAPTRCSMYGGMWTASSRKAGTDWTMHRRLLITTIGCGVCDDGRLPVDAVGGPIMLVEISVASRWQGPAVLRRLRDDELGLDEND